MKRFASSILVLPLLCMLTSCASYNARALNKVTPVVVASGEPTVTMAAKAFNHRDCKRYLDRDVLKKGYQPVQIDIENHTDKSYEFSTSRISLPCADAEEVARKVHTSTVGRATAYGTAAVLTVGLFAIPAIVDGVKSYQANQALDQDYETKAIRNLVIEPHSHASLIIFVAREAYTSHFSVTLVDEFSHQPEEFHLRAA